VANKENLEKVTGTVRKIATKENLEKAQDAVEETIETIKD